MYAVLKLPVAVRLDGAKHIPDDLLLPVDQFKRLPGPGAFGMAQTLDKVHGKICRLLVINRILRLEPRRLILSSASASSSPSPPFSHCRYTCSEIFAIITGGTLIPQMYWDALAHKIIVLREGLAADDILIRHQKSIAHPVKAAAGNDGLHRFPIPVDRSGKTRCSSPSAPAH